MPYRNNEKYPNQEGIVKTEQLNKGNVTSLWIRPDAIGEHQESQRAVTGTVTSSNIVGQVFRSSQDNISELVLSMQLDTTQTALDNFEAYADSAALQVEWPVTGSNAALLETTIVSPNSSSTKSMELSLAKLEDTWINTITATNLENQALNFDFYQTVNSSIAQLRFFIGDGTNTKGTTINVPEKDEALWLTFNIAETALADDGATSPNMAAITQIGFSVIKKNPGSIAYVDNLTTSSAIGSVEVKLYDMGAELPVAGTTALDDGTQYISLGDKANGPLKASTTVVLAPGKHLYTVPGFIAGVAPEIPGDIKLTPDNYYAITISYVNANVLVYGANPAFLTKYYNNGFAFTCPNTATAVTQVGPYDDIMFITKSIAASYIKAGTMLLNGFPSPNDWLRSWIEDEGMKITANVTTGARGLPTFSTDFLYNGLFLDKGDKLEVYYDDSGESSVTAITIPLIYYTEKLRVHN